MFKQLIEAFRHKDALSEMIDRFGGMLDSGLWMFNQACDVVERKVASMAVEEELYKRDRKINEAERDIREKIVVHLVMGNRQDVGICLVLMSVVKDAERIGDYCKNLFQIGDFFQGDYASAQFSTPLADIRKKIAELFPQAKQAFCKAEKKLAERCVAETRVIRKECDILIRQLLTPGGTIRPDEAAAYALRARFFKRVIAHLGNIATSVTNPVPMLDYSNNKPLDEPER